MRQPQCRSRSNHHGSAATNRLDARSNQRQKTVRTVSTPIRPTCLILKFRSRPVLTRFDEPIPRLFYRRTSHQHSSTRRCIHERKNTSLYIMEPFWDRQRYETAAYCLTMTSLYFTAMANGNSKIFHSEDLIRCVEKAGLKVAEISDGIGRGHSILRCVKAV